MDDFGFEDDLSIVQEDDDAEREKRLQAFDAQVDRQISILGSRKQPEDRRVEAAYWLGNSGAPKAIPILSKAYQRSKNKNIKRAAQQALGQFKALEAAIERDPGESIGDALMREENLHIIELLESITMDEQAGKRSRVSRSTVVRIQIGLVVSLILLVVLNVVLTTLTGDSDALRTVDVSNLNPADAQAIEALQGLQSNIINIRNPAVALQNEFEAGSLNCETPISVMYTINTPPEVQTAYPDVPIFGRRIEAAATQVLTTLNTRVEACAADRAPTPEEIEQATTSMTRTLADLSTLNDEINTLIDDILEAARQEPTAPAATDAPTATASPTETATPTPTVTPTPTLDPSQINSYIIALNFILEEVNGPRGSNTLLSTYWNDAQTAGRTDACRETPPTIPQDYDISRVPQEILTAAPQLEQAASQINTGLGLLREGWRLFQNSCQDGTLSANAPTGIIVAQTSNTAFDNANDLLLELRSR